MDKNLTIKDKIFTYLEKKGINKTEFYAETGIEPSNFKGKNKDSLPGSAMLVKILTRYSDLSADWLLTGRGEMLKTNDIVETTPQSTPIVEDLHLLNKNTKKNEDSQDNPQLFSQLLETVKQQAEEIGQLKARINELERSKGVDAGDVQSSGIANVG